MAKAVEKKVVVRSVALCTQDVYVVGLEQSESETFTRQNTELNESTDMMK